MTGLTEEDIGICPECKRNKFLNKGFCATCRLGGSNSVEPEEVEHYHLKLIAEIILLAVRDYRRKYSKWATPTTQQRSFKYHAIQDQANAECFIKGGDDSTFSMYCNLLRVAPARIRRYVLEK